MRYSAIEPKIGKTQHINNSEMTFLQKLDLDQKFVNDIECQCKKLQCLAPYTRNSD